LRVLAIGINAYEDRGWTPPGQTAPLIFPPLKLAVNDAQASAGGCSDAAWRRSIQ